MMQKKWGLTSSIALTFALVIGGCSSGDSSTKEPAATTEAIKAPDPVTVTMAANATALTDEELALYITNPLKMKYPHITVKRVDTAVKGQTIAELVTAGQTPDLYVDFPLNLPVFSSLQLGYNIEELIKKHQLDLNRFVPETLDSIKVGSDSSNYIGLPIFNNGFSLFYNKDVFDRFGVAYPKDGLMWEDVRDLAVKLTRSSDGVQYYGLNPDNVFRGAYQASLTWIDAKNDKAVFQTQEWKDIFDLWYSLYKVPGYPPKALTAATEFNAGRLAMMGGSIGTLKGFVNVKDVNWDMVTYPQNKKAPGVGQRVDALSMFITATSKNKDAAFQVMSVLYSDEIQTLMSQNARISVLKDPKIQNEFGKSLTQFQGKNVSAFIKLKMAPVKTFKNLPLATYINNAFNTVLYNDVDINTALRNADETTNAAIQTELLKKK